jgi:hypothetical protein
VVSPPKTQQASIRAVRQLAEYYDKSPDQITEEELRLCFLYLTTVKHLIERKIWRVKYF